MISAEFTIEAMKPTDWERVRSIYLEGIETGVATFETVAPSWANWDAAHLRDCRLVALDAALSPDSIVGWAALGPISGRFVYRGVAEVSVYVSASARGKGLGKLLLTKLIEESEGVGIWTLQAGIIPENIASMALHLSCGFRRVGRRERIGKVNGTWRDVTLFERRSPNVGTD
jgi:phosphinothricin acetyltransferase